MYTSSSIIQTSQKVKSIFNSYVTAALAEGWFLSDCNIPQPHTSQGCPRNISLRRHRLQLGGTDGQERQIGAPFSYSKYFIVWDAWDTAIVIAIAVQIEGSDAITEVHHCLFDLFSTSSDAGGGLAPPKGLECSKSMKPLWYVHNDIM